MRIPKTHDVMKILKIIPSITLSLSNQPELLPILCKFITAYKVQTWDYICMEIFVCYKLALYFDGRTIRIATKISLSKGLVPIP